MSEVLPSCENPTQLDEKTFQNHISHILFVYLCKLLHYLEVIYRVTELMARLAHPYGYSIPFASAGLRRNAISDYHSMYWQESRQ